jgi:hypothetical protein
MTQKLTAAQMILALTHYELEWVIDNPDQLADVAEFFANGGFANVNADDLESVYNLKLGEEA